MAEAPSSDPTVFRQRRLTGEERVFLTPDALVSERRGRQTTLRLAAIRSVRLERLKGLFSRAETRLVIDGDDGRIVLHAVATRADGVPFATCAERCTTRIVEASPGVRVQTGLSQVGYWFWVLVGLICVAAIIAALATALADASMLGPMPVVLLLLGGLPACWVNLSAGWPHPVSLGEMRRRLRGWGAAPA